MLNIILYISTMKQTQVVAAIIKEKNRYLIVQRNRNKHLGLKWEFPGGKVGSKESFKNAKKSKFTVLSYDRSKEPKKSKQKESSSISWGIPSSLNAKSPDIIYHKGDLGKEPMILIFGKNPDDVVKKASKITTY